ncbi:hypothetical protein LJC34_06210 [Oscillospiraceae bacterium OttesenSCG-928-G22]|nr:hypothetical protein [Oscillospiraceae bacterium OttesenSCG-928-G22]
MIDYIYTLLCKCSAQANANDSGLKSQDELEKRYRKRNRLTIDKKPVIYLLLNKEHIFERLNRLCHTLKSNWKDADFNMKLVHSCLFIVNFMAIYPFEGKSNMIALALLGWLLHLIGVPCADYGHLNKMGVKMKDLLKRYSIACSYEESSLKEKEFLSVIQSALQFIEDACTELCDGAASIASLKLETKESLQVLTAFEIYPQMPLGKTDVSKILSNVSLATIGRMLNALSNGVDMDKKQVFLKKTGTGAATKYTLEISPDKR